VTGSSHQPLIFDIRHLALDDGPGLRTTVFFKGCPLSCAWCHNPESMESRQEMAFYAHLCIGCGECRSVCPEGAIGLDTSDRIDRQICTGCGKCAQECPTNALKVMGRYYPLPELLAVLEGDSLFHETSGGGVTLSGGEPTLFMDYVQDLAIGLKAHNTHLALQTCGLFEMRDFKKKLLPYLDLIFYDLKIFDAGEHLKYTGRRNENILHNFLELCKTSSVKVIPRIPLVPWITATLRNLTSLANFLNQAGCPTCTLLPYNPAGPGKRRTLGKPAAPALPDRMMGAEEESSWRRLFDEVFNTPPPPSGRTDPP